RPAAHQAPPARRGGGPQAAHQDAAAAGHAHPATALRGHDGPGAAQDRPAEHDDGEGLSVMRGATAMQRATEGGRTVADRPRACHTHWTRLRGLLGTKRLEPGEGLWIKPSNQIHMFGMRYAIDVVFLDDGGRVLRLVHGLSPNRVSPRVAGATSVLEL